MTPAVLNLIRENEQMRCLYIMDIYDNSFLMTSVGAIKYNNVFVYC